MTNKRIVLTTCGSEEETDRIAHYLVENRLAACVSLIPGIKSIYRWQGKVESSEERLLVVKTTAEQFTQIQDAIKGLHSYELPECIAIAIDDGSAAYLEWVEENVR